VAKKDQKGTISRQTLEKSSETDEEGASPSKSRAAQWLAPQATSAPKIINPIGAKTLTYSKNRTIQKQKS